MTRIMMLVMGMMIMIIKKGVSKQVAYRIPRAMLLEVTYRNDTSTKSVFWSILTKTKQD